MSRCKRTNSHEGQIPSSSFTISQACLGSPLQFEPSLGTPELDDLVDAFVPGNGTLQQKRAQVSLEFFNAIELCRLSHPVSRRYQLRTESRVETHFTTSPSTASTRPASQFPDSTLGFKPLKKARQHSAVDSTDASSKRLPGFSIMTRDGVDITEYASRGPKTKAQRDHAALMRKLKACGPCKRSKQRCDPSHHGFTTTGSPAAATPSSATPSLTSDYSWSPATGSQASISPQSAVEDSFNQSPIRKTSTVAHVGGEFSPFRTPLPSLLSPSDISFDPLFDVDFNSLPLQDIDSQFFPVADVDLNFSPIQPNNFATLGGLHARGQASVPSMASTSSRLQTDQDWNASKEASLVSDADQLVSPTPNVITGSSIPGFLPEGMDDYVLYPESPQDGHVEQISLVANDLSLSDDSPVAKSMAFNFDGSCFCRGQPDPLPLQSLVSCRQQDLGAYILSPESLQDRLCEQPSTPVDDSLQHVDSTAPRPTWEFHRRRCVTLSNSTDQQQSSHHSTHSSSQDCNLGGDSYGNWNSVSLQNTHINVHNGSGIVQSSKLPLQQSVVSQSLVRDSTGALLTWRGELQTITIGREMYMTEKEVLSGIEADPQFFSAGVVTTAQLLENAITASSNLLGYAVNVLRLTMLLLISVADHCFGAILIYLAIYSSMILVALAVMIFSPQWTPFLVFILMKTSTSWPDVMPMLHIADNWIIGFEDSLVSENDPGQSKSKGIQEESRTCSSIKISDSYAIAPSSHSQLHQLYSRMSWLLRYCVSNDITRKMIVLKT